MAAAIADINKMVAKGDPKSTLEALQLPGAGLRAVHPECADTYQTKLAQSQANNANKGNSAWKYQASHLSGWALMVPSVLCALLQAAAMVFGFNIVSVTDITITTTWRQARVHGKSQRDFITEVAISAKKKSRCFCCHQLFCCSLSFQPLLVFSFTLPR